MAFQRFLGKYPLAERETEQRLPTTYRLLYNIEWHFKLAYRAA